MVFDITFQLGCFVSPSRELPSYGVALDNTVYEVAVVCFCGMESCRFLVIGSLGVFCSPPNTCLLTVVRIQLCKSFEALLDIDIG